MNEPKPYHPEGAVAIQLGRGGRITFGAHNVPQNTALDFVRLPDDAEIVIQTVDQNVTIRTVAGWTSLVMTPAREETRARRLISAGWAKPMILCWDRWKGKEHCLAVDG